MVESDGLENRYRSNPIEGSNPSLSAHPWASAEIGRQAGLRSPCSQGRVGSSPTSPTHGSSTSGHRPLVLFGGVLRLKGLSALLMLLLMSSPMQAQKRSAAVGVTSASRGVAPRTSVPPVPAIDTVGQWRHLEQRRLGRYKLSLPSGYATSTRTYPLILLLHGNGNTPQGLLTWFAGLGLDSVIVVAPEAPYVKLPETIDRRQGAYTGFGDAIALPDTMRGASLELTARWYADVLRDAMGSLRIDSTRGPLVVGFSQGGFFAHVLLTLIPEELGGIASICASTYPQWNVQARYVSVPQPRPRVFVAHGTADPIVPFSIGQSYKTALETVGFPFVFYPFAGGHWPTPDVDIALRQWIMSIIG